MTSKIILKPGRDKSVINRHPWIFSGGIASKDENITDNEIITGTNPKCFREDFVFSIKNLYLLFIFYSFTYRYPITDVIKFCSKFLICF